MQILPLYLNISLRHMKIFKPNFFCSEVLSKNFSVKFVEGYSNTWLNILMSLISLTFSRINWKENVFALWQMHLKANLMQHCKCTRKHSIVNCYNTKCYSKFTL